MQSEQTSIDAFINYIKILSLPIQTMMLYPEHPDFKMLKETCMKVISDFDKFVSDYNHKRIQQIKKIKLYVNLSFYRSIMDKEKNQDFMRYQYLTYGLKYIFMYVNFECFLRIKLYRNVNGKNIQSQAITKLESTFAYWMGKTLEKQKPSIQLFQSQAKAFLKELYRVLNGQILCQRCKRHILYNPDQKILLPPTVRCEQTKGDIRYYHQNCL